MTDSWESYFDFVFRYSYFSFLPPFITPFRSRFKYLSILFSLTGFIRIILNIVVDGKKNFEAFYSLDEVIQVTFRSTIYILQEKTFNEYFAVINNILKDKNDFNIRFHDIWQKNKPERFTKYYTWCQIGFITVWLMQAYYIIFFVSENLSDSPFPYYSPFFKWGGGYKVFNVVFDTFMLISLVCQGIQADLVTIALFYFAHCLLFHLELLLNEILAGIKDNKEDDYKIWIKRHVQVLNVINDLKRILRPHITIQYFSIVFGIVFCLLTLLEENTHQTVAQISTILSMILGLLFVLGYECSIAEKVEKTHSFMYQALLKSQFIYGKSKESYFLRLLILRCQRPIQISGYGFFSMDFRNFRVDEDKDTDFNLLTISHPNIPKSKESNIPRVNWLPRKAKNLRVTMQIYSFYSSLLSVKSLH